LPNIRKNKLKPAKADINRDNFFQNHKCSNLQVLENIQILSTTLLYHIIIKEKTIKVAFKILTCTHMRFKIYYETSYWTQYTHASYIMANILTTPLNENTDKTNKVHLRKWLFGKIQKTRPVSKIKTVYTVLMRITFYKGKNTVIKYCYLIYVLKTIFKLK